MEGYFVHFIAPENLPPMPKHVVFVLDTSGRLAGSTRDHSKHLKGNFFFSMQHRKMEQTIAAMVTILGEMRSKDYLTIISFATNIRVWELGESAIVKASPDNIGNAVKHVELLEAAGSTNINDAVLKALTILTHVKQKGILKDVQPMMFLLTDGYPTVGVTDTQEILTNIKKANSCAQLHKINIS